jgi:hypothetical protein
VAVRVPRVPLRGTAGLQLPMRPSGSDSRVRRQQQLLLLAGLLLVSLRTTASEEAEIAAAAAAANKAAPAAAVGGSPAAASPPAKGARPSSSSAARARVDPKGEGVAFDVFAAKLGKRLDRQLPKMSHREIFDAVSGAHSAGSGGYLSHWLTSWAAVVARAAGRRQGPEGHR